MNKDKYASRRSKSKKVRNVIDEITSDFLAVDIVNTNLIVMKIDGDEEEITPLDVKRYYNSGHGMSGYRTFAGVGGDLRMIDAIASDAFTIFNMLKPGRFDFNI